MEEAGNSLVNLGSGYGAPFLVDQVKLVHVLFEAAFIHCLGENVRGVLCPEDLVQLEFAGGQAISDPPIADCEVANFAEPSALDDPNGCCAVGVKMQVDCPPQVPHQTLQANSLGSAAADAAELGFS